MKHTRRDFLKGLGLLGLTAPLPGLGISGPWKRRRGRPVLISVFLRGGADALNMVVPHQEGNYYATRRNIAIQRPGGSLSALDLDGQFGLHPALKPLLPWYRKGRLAIVHAVGHPRATRSHFDEQDVWDTALIENNPRSTGWINRHLAQVAGHGPVRAVCLGERLVRSLRGAVPAQAVANLADLSLRPGKMEPARARAMLRALYGPGKDGISRAGQSSLAALTALGKLDLGKLPQAAGVHYPDSEFGRHMRQAVQLIRADVGVEVIACDTGSWDTHRSQGATHGRQADLSADLASSLNALAQDLGPDLDRVLVLVMSEFGRTLRQNGTGGTDHGRAGAVWILGGQVQGGRVLGSWPGLAPQQLYAGRELQWTTDFRSILAEILQRHLKNPNLAQTLPGFQPRFVQFLAETPTWTSVLFGKD